MREKLNEREFKKQFIFRRIQKLKTYCNRSQNIRYLKLCIISIFITVIIDGKTDIELEFCGDEVETFK